MSAEDVWREGKFKHLVKPEVYCVFGRPPVCGAQFVVLSPLLQRRTNPSALVDGPFCIQPGSNIGPTD